MQNYLICQAMRPGKPLGDDSEWRMHVKVAHLGGEITTARDQVLQEDGWASYFRLLEVSFSSFGNAISKVRFSGFLSNLLHTFVCPETSRLTFSSKHGAQRENDRHGLEVESLYKIFRITIFENISERSINPNGGPTECIPNYHFQENTFPRRFPRKVYNRKEISNSF